MNPVTNSRTCGRIGRTKWRRKCTESSINFEASWGFPRFADILIAIDENWQCGMSLKQLAPETELRIATFSQRNARNFTDRSDLIGQAVREISIFVVYFILGVARSGFRKGCPWALSVVGVCG